MPNFMTVQETADYLRVSKPTIQNLIADGKLPAVKLGPHSTRVPAAALTAFLERQINGAVAA